MGYSPRSHKRVRHNCAQMHKTRSKDEIGNITASHFKYTQLIWGRVGGLLYWELSRCQALLKSFICVDAFNLHIVSWNSHDYCLPIPHVRLPKVKWFLQSLAAGGWTKQRGVHPPPLPSQQGSEAGKRKPLLATKPLLGFPRVFAPHISVPVCFQCPAENPECKTQELR